MAIGDKKKISKDPTPGEKVTPSKKMFADASPKTSKVNLYVRDAELLKAMKIAALEDDTSLSLLFEEWGLQWLKKRSGTSGQLFM
ncbi:peptide transporter [Corynebacterium suicordis]|uniref:Peptide transporter n=1 Tax=Corynebacterium suicordis DSM 45110 TaxID=1121369 RepID=A0ABR9ZLU6_9CORY|nr:peptide transporter [Corynebacterium suicordis]MBF4554415.1 peptide transporter [Corynebacterium suicordis DSM 45110]MDR6278631.1 hypothetical protein [Corynebacterium suicordis]